MDFKATDFGDVRILVLPGETLESSNCEEFKREIASLLDPCTKAVFDMSQIHFIDSSGCGVLLSSLKKLRMKGGDVKLFCLSRRVNDLFKLIHMESVFGIFNTKEEACKAFQD